MKHASIQEHRMRPMCITYDINESGKTSENHI